LVCHTEIPSAPLETDSESLGSSLSSGSSLPSPDIPHNLEEALQALPAERHWMVEDLQHSDAGLNLLEALPLGTARACSDGSYYLGISTSAFTLSKDPLMRAELTLSTRSQETRMIRPPTEPNWEAFAALFLSLKLFFWPTHTLGLSGYPSS